jgi:choline-sulfatase
MVAAGTVLAAVGGWRYARASAPVSGPIILISIDALRADHLSLYGDSHVATPVLDALGVDGVVFERFYSHIPQSLPAHAAIFSGRLPFDTGVRDSAGFKVRNSERTLAEVLSDRDYTTAGVVSSYALRKETGIAQGFAFFDDDLGAGENAASVGAITRDGEISERIAERWLQSIPSPRAFLFLHLSEPRAPYGPPTRLSEYGPYDGEIAYADELVGRLVKYLKSHQLYDQSTIIVTSGYGEGLDDHGETAHGLLVYDDALRVPLIVKQAAGEGAGRRVSDLAQHIDLMPTILDLAKAPAPDGLRGRSLTPLLAGARRFPTRVAYSESLFGHYHFGLAPLFSITDGRHHFIRSARQELYDLETDPEERHNIVDAEPEVARELNAELNRLLNDASIEPPSAAAGLERERLEALGYSTANDFVTTTPDGPQPDPKDWTPVVNAYRQAVDHDVRREWPDAIRVLRLLTKEHPSSMILWDRLALVAERAERFDIATDARARVVSMNPDSADAARSAAFTYLKARRFDDAATYARQAIEMTGPTGPIAGSAFEVLTRVALARREPTVATEQAALATEADPSRPLRSFVEGRLLLDQRRSDLALPLLEKAIEELEHGGGHPIADLHLLTAESLLRLERPLEAEAQFLDEIRLFPLNVHARIELASLYHSMARAEEAGEVLSDLVRTVPTPDAFAQAARTWTAFGNVRQAAAVRAEARRVLPDPSNQAERPATHE